MSDDDARGDEIEALRSIYGDEDFVELGSVEEATRAGLPPDHATSNAYRVTLRSSGGGAAAAVGLAFRQPPGYPSSAPVSLAVRDVRGVGGAAGVAALHDLEEKLRLEADASVGDVCVYNLLVEASDWLQDWVEKHGIVRRTTAGDEEDIVETEPEARQQVAAAEGAEGGGTTTTQVRAPMAAAASLADALGAVTLTNEGDEEDATSEATDDENIMNQDELVVPGTLRVNSMEEEEEEDIEVAWESGMSVGGGGGSVNNVGTDSESDWSDAELREADTSATRAPPSAAQGSGRPWAHVSRARRARRAARAAEAAIRAAPPPPVTAGSLPRGNSSAGGGGGGGGDGVFLGDLDASAAIHVLSHLTPVERARVAACRRSERAALTSSGGGSGGGVGGVGGVAPAKGSATMMMTAEEIAAAARAATAAGEEGAAGHLADAAWREVNLRGVATPAALTTLRELACGSLRWVDVTGSRGLKRGELLELARESPQLLGLRASALGDTGKFTARDAELVFEACPSLRIFECDVGVKIDSKKGEPGSVEAELAATLGRREMRVRRLKIHSADAEATHAVAVTAASTAAAGRLQSLDVSWSLKLSDQAGRNVAAAMERHGRGWPLRRLAMRKANMHDEGAMSLAGAIRRSAETVAAHERREREDEEEAAASAGKGMAMTKAKKPLCRLRGLDLGSNMIQDAGAAAIAEALGPHVPITRLNLRDNQVGVNGCLALGHAVTRCSATLRRLDLAHSGFADAGAVALANGLRTLGHLGSNPSGGGGGGGGGSGGSGGGVAALRVLQLGFNSIGVVGVRALVEALTMGHLDGLEHLDLACNVLGPEGAAALAPLLERQQRRQHLSLMEEEEGGEGGEDNRGGGLFSLDLAVNNCAVDGERTGVRTLMKALETNTSLRMLNLRGNDLTSDVAGDIAEMLLENNTLTQLNVGYNKIYNDGAWELCEALSENTGLRGLDLQRNEISDEGGKHVETLLNVNSVVREVDMRSNMLSPETVDSFGSRFGERVNCRWQQEPPKKNASGAPLRKMVGTGGGNVQAKRDMRAAKKKAARGQQQQ